MNPSATIDIAHSIQLAVAPVFLLSAVGATLMVLTNRLSRIIDRARFLEGPPPVHLEGLSEEARTELLALWRRARLIQQAITLATAGALFISLVIATLFAGFALDRDLSWLIVVFFIASLAALVGSLLLFLLEIRTAMATLRFGPGPHQP